MLSMLQRIADTQKWLKKTFDGVYSWQNSRLGEISDSNRKRIDVDGTWVSDQT